MQRRRELLGMQSELPGAYRRVEYIASDDRGEYIDTLVLPSDSITIEMEFMPTQYYRTYQSPFGSYGANFGVYCYTNTSRRFVFEWCGKGNNLEISSDMLDVKHSLKVSALNALFDIDGISITPTKGNNAYPNWTITLFSKRNSSGVDIRGTQRIYFTKIYSDGTLIRSFIPCVRKSDNKPGMYDTVSKTFYINAGAGEFIVPA